MNFLYVIGALFVLGIVINVLMLSWPVCLPAAVAGAGWYLTSKSTGQPVKSAVHAVLGPAAVGLGLLSALLLAINVASPPADVITDIERTLVYLDNTVPSWTKLSPVNFIAVVVLLIAVSYVLPRLKLITRFLVINKYASRTVATLSAATSFTFFSNAAVVPLKAANVYPKVEALYRQSKDKERKSVDRFLAATAVRRALVDNTPSGIQYLRFVVESVAAMPAMDVASKRTLGGYVAVQLERDARLTVNAAVEALAGPPALPHRTALPALDAQIKAEKATASFADEAVTGVKEVLAKTLGLGNNELKQIGWSLIDQLVSDNAAALDKLAKPFVDKIVDRYFEQYTASLVSKQAEAIRTLFDPVGGGAAATRAAAARQTRAAVELMAAEETRLAARAAQEAIEAARTARVAASAGDSAKVDLELLHARVSSDRALALANSAKAAAQSMSAGRTALVAEAGTASVAIGAVEAARDLRIAGEAVEAARAARAAAQAAEAARAAKVAAEAVEGARAARAAAQGAEDAKMLFKAIPK